MKKYLTSLVIAGVVTGSLVAGGAAYAAAPAATAPSPASHHAAAGTAAVAADRRNHRRALRRAAVVLSARTIGITPKQLVTELRSGKSIAQVATEHNVSTQTVVTALTDAADARIAKAVSAGHLTQARATKLTAALPDRITAAVDKVR